MLEITTRQEFTDYCLRRLGEPVTKVNLDPTQISDAIDDAILKFVQYHRNGYEPHYFQYTIPEPAQGEQISREIIVPSELKIDSVIETIRSGSPMGGRFDTPAWQAGAAILSPENQGWSMMSLTDFTSLKNRLADINATLSDELVVRYTRYQRKITLMFQPVVGERLAFYTYRWISPDDYPEAWQDQWLKDYATAKIQERWGKVLSKVNGIKLVGGIEMNGSEILNDAKAELERLDQELKLEHQLPPNIFIG